MSIPPTAIPLLVLPVMLGGCADLTRPSHIRVSKADPAANTLIEIPANAVRKVGPDGKPYIEIPAPDDGSHVIPGYGRFVPTR